MQNTSNLWLFNLNLIDLTLLLFFDNNFKIKYYTKNTKNYRIYNDLTKKLKQNVKNYNVIKILS